MLNFETHNTLETEKLGEQLAKSLTGNEIIAFFGTMGMGKTAFIRGLCNGLNCLDDVSSPTFAIVHEYKGKYPVFHFDMYRIKDYDDLYSTGFVEYLNKNNQSNQFNLGNGQGFSVREVIESVKRVTGRNFNVTQTQRREGDPAILIGSSKKAKDTLGWDPQYVNIDKIIETAWNWHQKLNKE